MLWLALKVWLPYELATMLEAKVARYAIQPYFPYSDKSYQQTEVMREHVMDMDMLPDVTLSLRQPLLVTISSFVQSYFEPTK